jgi:uncharacterized protein (TIGR00251 family)
MIELAATRDGLLLPVKVEAGSRRNAVLGERDGALNVCVTQAPEKGKANQAVVEIVAKALGLRKSQIQVATGPTSPRKRLLVSDISVEELSAKLRELGPA